MRKETTSTENFNIKIVRWRPRVPRPTNPEIPQYLSPKPEARDTTYQKTRRKGEISSCIPLACHYTEVHHQATIRSTRHCLEDWAVLSKLTYYASRITSKRKFPNKLLTPRVVSRTASTKLAPHPSKQPVAARSPATQFKARCEEGNHKGKPPTQQCQQNN